MKNPRKEKSIERADKFTSLKIQKNYLFCAREICLVLWIWCLLHRGQYFRISTSFGFWFWLLIKIL